MSESTGLSGPDLAEGVPADTVIEGRPLLGHAHGESVMVVRSNGNLYATAATCTHYGGPLSEGLVVGTTVRCPWHHACFDLETGLGRGPGMTPLACFDLVQKGSLVQVLKKREATAPAVASGPRSVVIVGGGAAGAACAETLRRLGYRGPISLLADEPPGPVDRPNLSKDYLAGTAPEEWIPLRDAAFYREMNVDFTLGDAVVGVDTKARSVKLASGRSVAYGALLIATGAAPRRLPIAGADGANVHVLRTLEDARAIIAKAKAGARAVVIGASFIGLEVAASLRARSVAVDVVGPEAVPLSRVLGDEIGRFVRSLHEEHGVRFHLGRTPLRIADGVVELDDGAKLGADFVVLGVGVAPRTALAEAAGIAVDRGIVVDEKLRTSAEDVYAAGDVASYVDAWSGARVRIEHWVVAQRQGQAVARAMLGAAEPYREVPFFWSAHYDTTLAYVGHAEAWDRIATRGSLEGRKFVAAFERQGRVLGAVCVGEDALSLQIEAAMQAGDAAKVAALVG
jgi:NADPH-dependent 2,4-dienoyl-CoA reductase/sulfur reductase-like enzyme/nitrite reductase/ring-hydroxylating ferredoxin subunit